jgi:hypothetical protein
MSENEALDEHNKATADMEHAKQQFTAAVKAGMEGAPDAERRTADALSAQSAAGKRLADADATLEAIRQAKAEAERERKSADLEARWQRIAELCRKREKAAERAQSAALELGRAWVALMALQDEVLGALPVPGLRTSRTAGYWQEGTLDAVMGQMCVASNGGLAREALGHYTLSEFHSRAIDLPSKVRAQHRQILLREGGKPMWKTTIPDTEIEDGPSAA